MVDRRGGHPATVGAETGGLPGSGTRQGQLPAVARGRNRQGDVPPEPPEGARPAHTATLDRHPLDLGHEAWLLHEYPQPEGLC